MNYWKRKRALEEARETDIEHARAELVQAQEQRADVLAQGPQIAALSSYLADRRQQNHFGDSLELAFTPRRRHV